MQPISEKWEVTVGKKTFVLTDQEVKAVLNAGDARFVKLKDLVINPAFIQSIVMVERINPNQIESAESRAITDEERAKIRARLKVIKESYGKPVVKTI